MSFFSPQTPDNAAGASLAALERARNTFGFVPNLISTMAESPSTAEGYLDLHEAFARSTFSPVEQQVVVLTASRLHRCHYCMAAESAVASMVGMSPDLLMAIRHGESPTDTRIAALVDFTTAVVESRGWVGEEKIGTFLKAGFEPGQVFEVVLGVAKKVMSNYVNHMAETPLDPAFAPTQWTEEGGVAV